MTNYAKLNFISLFYKQKYTFILYFLSLHPPHTHNTLLLKDHWECGPKYYIHIKIQQEEGQSMT